MQVQKAPTFLYLPITTYPFPAAMSLIQTKTTTTVSDARVPKAIPCAEPAGHSTATTEEILFAALSLMAMQTTSTAILTSATATTAPCPPRSLSRSAKGPAPALSHAVPIIKRRRRRTGAFTFRERPHCIIDLLAEMQHHSS